MNEVRVRIISVLKFISKTSGNLCIRLDYFIDTDEAYRETENYVGFESHDYFSEDIILFEKAKNLIMRPVILTIAQEPSKNNPMKLRAVIKDIRAAK